MPYYDLSDQQGAHEDVTYYIMSRDGRWQIALDSTQL